MPHGPVRSWSNPGPAPAARRVPARAWKAVAVLLGLAACVAAITYAVLWLTPPKAPRLMVMSAAYDDTQLVPENAGSGTAGQGFVDLNRSAGRGRLRPDAVPYRLTRGEAANTLAKLASLREPAVVMVFAANGGCDGDGPFLIPDDATTDPADRVRVKAILAAAAKLPADTRKLLVFDAAGSTSATVLGQFHNDFFRGVTALDTDIAAVPNLVVFVSAGPDQRSWRSPEWGESAFLHHLRAGLAGNADANGDSRLSATELVAFTTRRTREWARDQRGALQTPELLPRTDGPRRADDMTLGIVDRPATTDAEPAVFDPPAKWEMLWNGYTDLDRASSHPASYAPELWRQFVGWLLRRDRLLADGDESSAARVLVRADGVYRQILIARTLTVSPQTLALPSALGATRTDSDLVPVIAKVAQASPADRPAEWEKAKQQGDRLALGRALVRWVADDPLARRKLAPPVVTLISEGFSVVPAELHFLTKLADDLPDHPATAAAWPLVKRVLRLRLQAEETATGAEGEAIRPWIADKVRTADLARRQAEDLLFATDAGSWAKANTFATTAEGDYADAARTAEIVRSARRTWHTAVFHLNGLSEWLAAGDHPTDLLGRMTREEWLTAVRTTWADAHRLGEWCNGPPAADTVEGLKTQAKLVADRVGEVRDLHSAAVARLLGKRPPDENRADLARWWHAADTLLSVPFAERRGELLVELRRVSRQLHVLATTKPEPQAEPPADEVRERAFDAARRRGLLHLATLGGEAYRLAAGDGFDRTVFQIDQFSRQADAPAELIAASDRYAAAVRQLPGIIPTTDDTLPTADRLARVSPVPVAPDPAVRLRTVRAEQLLLWQADRTVADRWSGGDTAKPYYRHAADVLRNDARTLAARPAAPTPTPATPFPFSVPPPTEVVVTDDPGPKVAFTLEPANRADVGFVAYQLPGAAAREVRSTAASPAPLVVLIPARTTPLPTAPVVEASTLAVRGYFRGETVETKATVARHPVPHATAVRTPADNAVSVAVRPTPGVRARFGSGNGHLHFVIDCSGSMGPGDEPAASSEFAAACDKLEAVLAAVPPGVTVAVSAFGQQTGAKSPEETFTTLRPAGVWGGAADVPAVMKEVRALRPWDKSAVVRSAIKARAAVPDTTAARAVILFSDCADNRFTDPAANPKPVAVKDALRAAFDGGCPLHVVAFPAEKAAAAVREEFKAVTTFKPAGLFIPPEETDKLIDWIRAATAPRVRLKWTPDGGASDDLASGSEAADNWLSPLPRAGRFSVELPALKLKQPVELRAGERLLLTLAGDREVRFTRPNFAAEVPAADRKPAGGWTAAVPRVLLNEAGGLELVALADHPPAGDTTVLSPARVADVWFELAPSSKSPVAVRWANTTGWPCPAWAVETPAWPADGGKPAVPTLTAWWSGRPFPAAGTWMLPADKRLPANVATTAGEVTVNGVSVETHGGRECLVVRLTHPAGSPVYPRVADAPPDGSEVRIYREANRVTALFWWADAADRAKARTLEFVAVSDAKKQAESARTFAVLTLPPPTAGTPAPPPAPR